jgi:hypothetical protein
MKIKSDKQITFFYDRRIVQMVMDHLSSSNIFHDSLTKD